MSPCTAPTLLPPTRWKKGVENKQYRGCKVEEEFEMFEETLEMFEEEFEKIEDVLEEALSQGGFAGGRAVAGLLPPVLL